MMPSVYSSVNLSKSCQIMEDPSTAVVLFAYNRPRHFEKTLQHAVKEFGNRGLSWYVFIDGPKSENKNAILREIATTASDLLYNEVSKITKRPINIGLKASVILGVTEVFEAHEQVIVLEDDLIVQHGACDFFMSGFKAYKNQKNIGQISGFSYTNFDHSRAYFLPITNSWGWATWRDRWDNFIGQTLSEDIREFIPLVNKNEFDLEGAYGFTSILEKELKGKVSSWAILFYLHSYRKNLYTLYPPFSLIFNGGFDGSGTHGSKGVNKVFLQNLESRARVAISMPSTTNIDVDKDIIEVVKASLKKLTRLGRLKQLWKF